MVGGANINHEKSRVEWNTSVITHNIFQILGTIQRDMRVKMINEPYLLEDGVTWAQDYERNV